ncbi:MAG: MYXO-CTERM sorting domain-containing protein [Myxococcota bacterium]
MVRVLASLAAAATLFVAAASYAYQYDSPITDGCHEGFVTDALRVLRSDGMSAAILPATADEALFVADLPFGVPGDMRDPGAATLLVAVRDLDLKGRSGIDTEELAAVHGEDDSQREHCLRRSGHDEPTGTEAAIAECRAYIRERLFAAIEHGLLDSGEVNGAARVDLRVNLTFRGTVSLSLPLAYVYLGQAVHALQDGYSHTFRTSDQQRVTVATNWIDFVNGTLDEARDGPGHMQGLDECNGVDGFRAERLELVREVTLRAMRAVLDPSLDRQQRFDEVDDLIAAALTVEPGCTFDNNWCDAAELAFADPGCGCRMGGGPADPRLVVGLLAGLGLWAWRRPR